MSQSALISFPQRPEDRLRLALRQLEEALAAQSRAVSAWRSEIGALSTATERLDGSLTRYRDGLDGLAQAAAVARQEAQRLERTAARMASLAVN